ncbi:MAG: DMT family transporter [Candidatus Aminicenantes bacterium]|nr:DMT family transporter [Candidatus Aminicenantes bacterium]
MPETWTKTKGFAEIHSAVALFGLAGLFGQWLPISPFIIVLGRVVFGSLALGGVLVFRRRQPAGRPGRGQDRLIFVLWGFILAVHWASFFRSIQVSSVAVGLLSYSTFPLFTSFLEPLVNRERWERRHFILSLGCLAGVFLIIPRFDLAQPVVQGVGWGMCSGLLFALLTITNRKLTARHSALVIAFYQDFWAGVFLLPFLFIIKPSLSARDILLLAVLGVACTALAHTLFIRGLKWVSARTASIISALEPVYGIILAYFFLREIPAGRTVWGGAVIVASCLWASFSDRRLRP